MTDTPKFYEVHRVPQNLLPPIVRVRGKIPSSKDTDLTCAFCGSTDISFIRHKELRSITGEMWASYCCECGATFPNKCKKQLLIDCWIRRPKNGK